MKVLHVIPSIALAHGGPSRAIRIIEQALRTEGVHVEVATTDDDGSRGRIAGDHDGTRVEDGETRRYFRKSMHPYKVSLPFAAWIFRHVRDYDLVHIHALFSFTSSAAAIAARRAGVPYVLRPLGTLSDYGVKARRPGLKRLSLRVLERGLLRDAAAVHFTSEMERQEADALGIPMRGIVLPLAVKRAEGGSIDTLARRFPALRDRRFMLFLSRLDPKKNVESLLGAIALNAQSMPDARWLIAGSGDTRYVDSLHGMADSLGVADKVVWAGHLDGELKAAALQHAEALVLPSFSENFGIAAAEALAAGLPCVLGQGVAISRELSEAGAAIAVKPDPDSIAEAMRQLWCDQDLRGAMGANAHRFANEHYSPEAMGKALHALYRHLLVHGA